ncbi:MAG: hypothetical protein ABIH10_01210 [Spirochaetota bacterium]
MIKHLPKMLKFLLAFVLITGWIFFGWPKIISFAEDAVLTLEIATSTPITVILIPDIVASVSEVATSTLTITTSTLNNIEPLIVDAVISTSTSNIAATSTDVIIATSTFNITPLIAGIATTTITTATSTATSTLVDASVVSSTLEIALSVEEPQKVFLEEKTIIEEKQPEIQKAQAAITFERTPSRGSVFSQTTINISVAYPYNFVYDGRPGSVGLTFEQLLEMRWWGIAVYNDTSDFISECVSTVSPLLISNFNLGAGNYKTGISLSKTKEKCESFSENEYPLFAVMENANFIIYND